MIYICVCFNSKGFKHFRATYFSFGEVLSMIYDHIWVHRPFLLWFSDFPIQHKHSSHAQWRSNVFISYMLRSRCKYSKDCSHLKNISRILSINKVEVELKKKLEKRAKIVIEQIKCIPKRNHADVLCFQVRALLQVARWKRGWLFKSEKREKTGEKWHELIWDKWNVFRERPMVITNLTTCQMYFPRYTLILWPCAH